MREPEILEGAEQFEMGAGPVGALLVHGFTGCPQSLKPVGEHLAGNGIKVLGIRLPGHGTTWEDLNSRRGDEWDEAVEAGFQKLEAECEEVFIVTLSFGMSLAIHFDAIHPGRAAGIVSLAGFVMTDDPLRHFTPVMRYVLKSVPGVGNDIADPEGREICYDRVPVAAAHHMLRAAKRARDSLPRMSAPLLVIHSRNDHTSKPVNAETIYRKAGSPDKEIVWLERSYHVITLDFDKDEVYRRTLEFIRQKTKVGVK
jgi:carboxylesterase